MGQTSRFFGGSSVAPASVLPGKQAANQLVSGLCRPTNDVHDLDPTYTNNPGYAARKDCRSVYANHTACCDCNGSGDEGDRGRRLLDVLRHAESRRPVSSKPRHTVEVGIVAGNMGQPVRSHHGHDKGIPTKEAVLLADFHRRKHMVLSDGKYLNSQSRNSLDGLPECGQSLYLGRLPLQAVDNPGCGPAKDGHGLEGHQPVCDVAQYVCRRKSGDIVLIHPFQEFPAGNLQDRVRCEVINGVFASMNTRVRGAMSANVVVTGPSRIRGREPLARLSRRHPSSRPTRRTLARSPCPTPVHCRW